MRNISALFAACVVFISHPLFANQSQEVNSVSASEMLAKVVIGLVLVLVLILAFAWLARRLGYAGMMASRNNNMTYLGSLTLGAREKAVLLEVEGVKLLLGVAPGNVTCLHQFDKIQKNIDDEESVNVDTTEENTNHALAGENAARSGNDFAHHLKQILFSGGSHRP